MKHYRFGELDFSWDERQASQNARRHGIRFEEAATVFVDPLARVYDDPDHSETEPRFLLVGHSLAGRMLLALLKTVSDVLELGREPELEWRDSEGERRAGAAVIVVSNNPYRFGPPLSEPTRPSLDACVLGIAVFDRSGPRTWSTPSFEMDAHAPVQAGIDGEPVLLTPPLRFCVRPKTLRCRIACHHPGASPSAFVPKTPWQGLRALVGIAAGRRRVAT